MAVALIVAAGLGERLGASRPKALVELAGQPLVQWSVDVLLGVPAIERIVVALPADVQAPVGTIGVLGGAVRSESVKKALAAAGEGDPVLVHDAARPLLSAELVQAALATVAQEGVEAAIAAAPVTDTVKRVGSTVVVVSSRGSGKARLHSGVRETLDGSELVVRETLDRSELWAVQTPQVFRRAALDSALDVTDEVLAQATDDAWLVERSGGRVVVVPASPENLKVTTPLDLALAEILIARRGA